MHTTISANMFNALIANAQCNDTRFYLHGVLFDEHNAVATDGHAMLVHAIKWDVDADGEPDVAPTPFILSRDQPHNGKHPKAPKDGEVWIDAAEHKIVYRNKVGVIKYQSEFDVIDGKFPDYATATPALPDGPKLGINPALIHRTTGALGCGVGIPHTKNTMDARRCSLEGHDPTDTYLVVMPMRLS